MKWKIALLLFIFVFFLQAITLPKVGMTWDEPSSFFIGRANLKFWLTRDRSYITDFKDKEKFKNDPIQYIYGEDTYPPFSFVVASGFSYVLAEHFHLMSPIVAHHLGLVFLGALGITALYGIGITIGFSEIIAVGTALIAFFYPTIIGQMRNDAKDVPLMSMISIFMFFFIKFLDSVKKGNGKAQVFYGFMSAILLGLTEGTKPSAAIIVPILGVWFVFSLIFFPLFRRKMKPLPQRLFEAVIFSAIALAVFFLVWPWLWDDPRGKIVQVMEYFKTVGFNMPVMYWGGYFHAGVDLPKAYPFSILAIQTPSSVLALFVIGILLSIFRIFKRRDPYPILFLLWFAIGICRFLIPGMLIYAKVRHFIDAMPAFFFILGMGLDEIRRLRLPGKLSSINISLIILTIAILHEMIISIIFFPYEPSYFNIFAGGTKHVAEKHLFDIEYWASGVKEAMEYIESHTNGPVGVYGCTMGHLALFYGNANVKVAPGPTLGQYSLIPNSVSWFGQPLGFMMQHHELVYTIKRDGAELFYIFKHKPDIVWFCGYETETNYDL